MSGDPQTEWVDWVDAEDRVLGRVTRDDMRRRNLWHRTVAILVQSSTGAVYIHRRSHAKDLFPGLLDLFVGGVVAAGEDYAQAAAREIEEELGIREVGLEFLFATTFESPETRARIHVYRCGCDGPFTWQPSEVLWGDFVPPADLERWFRVEAFVPDGIQVYRELVRRRPDLVQIRPAAAAKPAGGETEPEPESGPGDRSLPEAGVFSCQVCGRENSVRVEVAGGEHQELIEDCTFCCSPNRLVVTWDPDTLLPEIEVREP
jgi:8-oxo-dGTP pyrophosphatase MutT (NUDIX family)